MSEIKKRLAEEHKRQSNPDLMARKVEKPIKAASTSQVFKAIAVPPPRTHETVQEKSAPAVLPPPAPTPPPPAPKAADAVLSSEADDWESYMDGLAGSEGPRFETGFEQLDKGLGGVKPCLMLLMDEDSQRRVNFMKQVTDQFASGSTFRCLYFANELPKAVLRLRTLARLAAVPISDLERGRLKKDSPEWQRLDAEGRRAADWLKRVFVYEVDGELDLVFAGELVDKLLTDSGDESCIVVIDSLDKIMRGGRSSQDVMSQLKTLADSRDSLILAATTDPTLLAFRDVDLAAIFRGSEGAVELEVLKAENDDSTSVTFDYEPDYCRFTER